MTKEEFEGWVGKLSADDQHKAKGTSLKELHYLLSQGDIFWTGFFNLVRRDSAGLVNVSYAEAYKEYLVPAKQLLTEAASATVNESLRTFLTKRAEALSSNEYAESDIAWMEIDDNAALDITIGPYEVYRDELLNYKASFEAFIALKSVKASLLGSKLNLL